MPQTTRKTYLNNALNANTSSQFQKQIGFEIAIRDTRTGNLQRTLRWDDARINRTSDFMGNLGDMGLAFSPDNALLAGAGPYGAALWDVKQGRILHILKISGVDDAQFSPDGSLVAMSGVSGKVSVWSTKTGELLQTFNNSRFGSTRGLAFSPDGKFLASGEPDGDKTGVVKVWDVQNLN